MKSTEHWLVHDHSEFEYLIGQCREAADINDWWALEQAFNELVKKLKHHMAQEDEVLFPAYEARTSAPYKPTLALRDEHDLIVKLFRDAAGYINARDADATEEVLQTLQFHMIQHHEKEEEIFLPMASHILCNEREELSQKLAQFVEAETPRDWGFEPV